MSRNYKVDITLVINQDVATFKNETEPTLVQDVLIYLLIPALDPNDKVELDKRIQWYGDDFSSWSIPERGVERTTVQYDENRPFNAGYGEEDFEEDLLKQVERLQKAVPYTLKKQNS
jgi:hypothetical protein